MNRLAEILRRIFRRQGDERLEAFVVDHSLGAVAGAVAGAMASVVAARAGERVELGHLLAERMRQVGPREWTGLYPQLRGASLRSMDVATLAKLPVADAVALLGVASLNHDGHVRQAAVRALGQTQHPRALPYVLLRLSDWVQAVREEAQRALDRLLAAEQVDALVQSHFLIQRLLRVERVDLAPTHERILAHLRDPQRRPQVLRWLEQGDEHQRRFLYRVLEGELLNDPTLLAGVLADRSPTVRAWAAARVMANEPARHVATLRTLLADRSPRVRLPVLQWLSPALTEALLPEVREQLFAASAGVRQAAQYLLRRRGEDLATVYRQRVSAWGLDKVTPGVVAGLGEVGQKEDVARLRPLFAARRPRVRAAALQAAARLDAPAVVDDPRRALGDPFARGRRVAVAALGEQLDEATLAFARYLFRKASPSVQRDVLRLLSQRGGWEVVPDLLAGLLIDDAHVRQEAWRRFRAWLRTYRGRPWLTPSPGTRAELRAVLEQLRHHAPEPPDREPAFDREVFRWLAEVAAEPDRSDRVDGR